MRFHNFAAVLAVAAMGVASASAVESGPDPFSGFDVYRPNRKRGKGQSNRRGKGLRSKPKRRPNMLHVSKRVRRKHRRAA